MRSKSGNLTPKQAAQEIILKWIKAAYLEATMDLERVDDRDSFRAQVKHSLAQEHDRLLARTNLHHITPLNTGN